MKRLAFVLAAAVGLAAASCRQEATERSPDAAAVSAAPRELTFPTDFPQGVSAYPGSTVTASAVGGEATNAVLRSTDPLEKVIEWYKKTMKEGGWEIGSAVDDPLGSVFSARKGKQTVVVVVTAGEGATTVSLTLQK